MGYSETVCQLCGVSFAIARLRRADEPTKAGWSYSGHGFVNADGFSPECDATGCRNISREGVYGPDNTGANHSGIEHLPATGCVFDRGYNGQRISLEEMKGCRAIQSLLRKEATQSLRSQEWKPERDDEDFELNSGYFLTGVGDGSPDESYLENLTPVRHGIDSYYPYNTRGENEDFGLPFHPTCFDIFKRICINRLGHVDVHGLWSWRETLNYADFFENFPHAFAVKNARQQWWTHEPGCEYLAANPVDVPSLSLLLKSCIKEKMVIFPGGGRGSVLVPFDVNHGIYLFKHPGETVSTYTHNEDPPDTSHFDGFMKLSSELRYEILSSLSSRDIANLRTVTPAYRQLPVILFRSLILREMPWLFEAKDMPLGSTDWFMLYKMFKGCWQDLMGLRNRKRIWKDVEEVVGRIDNYRKLGKIVDEMDDES